MLICAGKLPRSVSVGLLIAGASSEVLVPRNQREVSFLHHVTYIRTHVRVEISRVGGGGEGKACTLLALSCFGSVEGRV